MTGQLHLPRVTRNKQESHAIARKPHDATAVRFGLKFADSKVVIQGHIFWGQWKGDKGLNNTM